MRQNQATEAKGGQLGKVGKLLRFRLFFLLRFLLLVLPPLPSSASLVLFCCLCLFLFLLQLVSPLPLFASCLSFFAQLLVRFAQSRLTLSCGLVSVNPSASTCPRLLQFASTRGNRMQRRNTKSHIHGDKRRPSPRLACRPSPTLPPFSRLLAAAMFASSGRLCLLLLAAASFGAMPPHAAASGTQRTGSVWTVKEHRLDRITSCAVQRATRKI